MSTRKPFATVSLALALSACVVVPVEDEVAASSCDTYTKSMTLKTVTANGGGLHCRDEACLAVILAVSAGSLIVSGSIVLTNNTVHWLEYQGSCDDSFLNTTKQRFLDSLDDPKPVSAKLLAQ
ncbi:MAG: hypothetical protein A2100_01415 [Sideroxydans sp. GWF2_59_14]|nr:MAG: hypothetical protein A2100_01415 [Sideroxydans sp. GWF2_59_14]HAF44950.1 hypothetical protein [Gallionellaceae bacterium]